MNQSYKNYLVDVILAITFIITSISGLVLLVFSKKIGIKFLLGLSKFTWIKIHNLSGIIMILLVKL